MKFIIIILCLISHASFAEVSIRIKRKQITPKLFEIINEGQNIDVWQRTLLYKKAGKNFNKYKNLLFQELEKTSNSTIKNILLTHLYSQESKLKNRSFFNLNPLEFNHQILEFEQSLLKNGLKGPFNY